MSNPVYAGIYEYIQTRSPIATFVAGDELAIFERTPGPSQLATVASVLSEFDPDIGYDLLKRYEELTAADAAPNARFFSEAGTSGASGALPAVPWTYERAVNIVLEDGMNALKFKPDTRTMMVEIFEIYREIRREDYRNGVQARPFGDVSAEAAGFFLLQNSRSILSEEVMVKYAAALQMSFKALMILMERNMAAIRGADPAVDSFAAMDFPGYWSFKDHADASLAPGYLDAIISTGLALQPAERPRRTLIIGPSAEEIRSALLRGEKVVAVDHSIERLEKLALRFSNNPMLKLIAGHFPDQIPFLSKTPFDLIISFSSTPAGEAVFDLVFRLAEGGMLLFQQQTPAKMNMPDVSGPFITLVNNWGAPQFESDAAALYPLGMSSVLIRRAAANDLEVDLGVDKLLGGGQSGPSAFGVTAKCGCDATLLEVVTGRVEGRIKVKDAQGLKKFGESLQKVQRFGRYVERR